MPSGEQRAVSMDDIAAAPGVGKGTLSGLPDDPDDQLAVPPGLHPLLVRPDTPTTSKCYGSCAA